MIHDLEAIQFINQRTRTRRKADRDFLMVLMFRFIAVMLTGFMAGLFLAAWLIEG